MNPKFLVLQIVFGIFCLQLSAQNRLIRVKIFPPESKSQQAELLGALEIDHYAADDGFIIAEITENVLPRLKASKFRYNILEADVTKKLEELNAAYFADRLKTGPEETNRVAFEQPCKTVNAIIATPSTFQVKPTFGGYYSYNEMIAAIDALVLNYPTLAQKFSIGTSAEGRTIWGIKISDNVTTDEQEPELMYMGLQHAREAIGGSSMIFLMTYLCEFYAANNGIKNLVDNREFFIFPCVNPDGWEYNRNNGGVGTGWRKNRRPQSGGSIGVDLNRNWGVDWGNCSAPILGSASSCGSGTPSSDTYYGTNSFSEPETQALRIFVQSRNIVAGIDQHSYGPYYSLPFGRSSLHSFGSTPGLTITDSLFYVKTGSLMGKYNGMRSGNSYQSVGYEVAGGCKDWMLFGDIGTGTKGKVYGLTGEGGAGGGTGGTYGSFWAPASQIINLCRGMTYQNLQLALISGSYAELEDGNDIAVTSVTGNFGFSLRRIGIQSGTVNVSVIPVENIQSVGAPVNVTSLTNYNDTYSGNISYVLPASITSGQRIRFAWRVESGGQVYQDTVVKFYNPVQLFFDNMEGSSVSTNWTVSGGWNYTTTSAYQGTKSLTESPSGNYTNNSTRLATCKNTFNLTDATAVYLSLWTRHRAENFRDKLQVKVSTNGNTWIPVCGSTTVQEPGTLDGSTINGQPSLTGIEDYWSRNLFDLSAYKGNASLRLRLEFTSNAASSGFAFGVDDGFYIDNLKVIKSTATLPATRASVFNSIDAKLLLHDKAVEVKWETFATEQQEEFVVERSINGKDYHAIGNVKGFAPFSFVDKNPASGSNFYRVKAITGGKDLQYSKSVMVLYNPGSTHVVLYPNPVYNQLWTEIISDRLENVTISIFDSYGRLIKEQRVAVMPGNNKINIPLSTLAAQTYMIKVFSQQRGLLTVQKIIKQ